MDKNKESIPISSIIENELRLICDKNKLNPDNKSLTDEQLKIVMNDFIKRHDEYKYFIHDELMSVYLKNPLCGTVEDTTNKNTLLNDSRAYMIEKKTLKRLYQHSPQILYDKDAEKYIEDNKIKWKDVSVYNCFKETMLVLYNYNDEWKISTIRNPNAFESYWNSKESYGDAFKTYLKDIKIKEKHLNKKYCYFFIYIDKKNKTLVDYSKILNNNNYRVGILTGIYKKYTMKPIICDNPFKKTTEITNGIFNQENTRIENIKNYDQLKDLLRKHSKRIMNDKVFDFAGYTLKANGRIMIMRPKAFRKVELMRPNHSNEYTCYLELYQKNKLLDYLDSIFISDKSKDKILNIIDESFKQMTKEILKIYHDTRNHQNKALFELLPKSSYQNILFDIHGIYIKRKKESNNLEEPEKTKTDGESKTINKKNKNTKDQTNITVYDIETKTDKITNPININIKDVYNFLKSIEVYKLSYLFYERMVLLESLRQIHQSIRPKHPVDHSFWQIKDLVRCLFSK